MLLSKRIMETPQGNLSLKRQVQGQVIPSETGIFDDKNLVRGGLMDPIEQRAWELVLAAARNNGSIMEPGSVIELNNPDPANLAADIALSRDAIEFLLARGFVRRNGNLFTLTTLGQQRALELAN